MIYWNTLEHLTKLYWKKLKRKKKKIPGKKPKTKILKEHAINKLRENLKIQLDEISDSDIDFPYITSNDVRKLIGIRNDPPIKIKIFTMCRKIKLNLKSEEVSLIKMVSYLRDKLFHENYYLTDMLDEFRKKFKLPEFTLRDFGLIVQKFSMLLEKIILKILKFIPYYFELSQKEKYHRANWKKIKLPSYKLKIEERNRKIDEKFKKSRMNELSWEEEVHNKIVEDKKEIFRHGKYISLLKYLERFKHKIRDLTRENFFEGIIKSKRGRQKIFLKFSKDLNGEFKTITKDPNKIQLINFERTFFKSLKSYKLKGFIEFELFLRRWNVSPDLNNRDKNENTGNFITLLIDIKNSSLII